MNKRIFCRSAEGKIKSIASKSVAHRLLICAAFADAPTRIRCDETNKDIEATAACLSALGAKIERNESYYTVTPVKPCDVIKGASLPCGESGSTLRFLLPVAAALGADCSFELEGRLPDRPLSPLREELEAHGIAISGKNPLQIRGKLVGNSFSIDGNVSSQFISGLLFALTLLDTDGTLKVNGKLGSAPYVDITCDALSLFGAPVSKFENTYKTEAHTLLCSPCSIEVEGDWSNAAFPLALGAIGKEVEVLGLSNKSSQGDKAIVDLLRRFGADIIYNDEKNSYVAKRSDLHGIEIDASQIPDLVPILATVASVAKGRTIIYGASRLRLKESDRLESVSEFLNSLGADVTQTDDGLIINGVEQLSGAKIDSFNDHRIAMSAAVASAVCEGEIILSRAEAVEKSYPSFWQDMLGVGIISEDIYF
ncbi:MAG: 3-phosphoshikimate 1-carboxyvinyltransferase [Ruminococcaceae bacterium]|nr:3-phosphoshikimate 1-carboxyvinyltransferase [Oscillospiraceae bacterium]